MSVGYTLVNHTKKEHINFSHIPSNTARELAGNPVSAAIISWYLLKNCGDNISFVSDTYDDWPFPGSPEQLLEYSEVTDEVVTALIKAEILVDEGIAWADEDEPEQIYIRALRNRWMDK